MVEKEADKLHSFSTLATEVLLRGAITSTASSTEEEQKMERVLRGMDIEDLSEWAAEIVAGMKPCDDDDPYGLKTYNLKDVDSEAVEDAEEGTWWSRSHDDDIDYTKTLFPEDNNDNDADDENEKVTMAKEDMVINDIRKMILQAEKETIERKDDSVINDIRKMLLHAEKEIIERKDDSAINDIGVMVLKAEKEANSPRRRFMKRIRYQLRRLFSCGGGMKDPPSQN